MPSSYNVIKKYNVLSENTKVIDTSFEVPVIKEDLSENTNSEGISNISESYENIGQSIIDNARRQREILISKAIEEAQNIEKEAYEKGYSLGHEQGYKDAYEQNIEKAKNEASQLIEHANAEASVMLLNAKEEYEKYLEEKKQDVLKLVFTIAEKILQREVEKEQGIDSMIYNVIKEQRESKTYIIKCHENHVGHIKESIEEWRANLALQSDIFVVSDNTLEEGSAIIEKDNGKVIVSIDIGLENIKREIF